MQCLLASPILVTMVFFSHLLFKFDLTGTCVVYIILGHLWLIWLNLSISKTASVPKTDEVISVLLIVFPPRWYSLFDLLNGVIHIRLLHNDICVSLLEITIVCHLYLTYFFGISNVSMYIICCVLLISTTSKWAWDYFYCVLLSALFIMHQFIQSIFIRDLCLDRCMLSLNLPLEAFDADVD